MSNWRIILTFAALIAALSLPSVAHARVVPPENSAVTQYTETYPTPGGGAMPEEGTETGEAGPGSPNEVLGSGNSRRLEELGPEGRDAVELATGTAPDAAAVAVEGPSGKSRAPAAGPTEQGNRNESTGLSEVLGRAVGSSSSGGSSLLVPVAIICALVGSVAYFVRRQRWPT